ncbi:MAG: heme exporter protein CcmD [Pseudomonadota bacterium]
MPDLGPYSFYVLTSYGVTLALIFGLVIWSWMRSQRVAAQLKELEEKRQTTQTT